MKVDGRNKLAHRWAYEQFIGPIPEGLDLDHFACDNPSCVNPAHVRPTTRRENLLRGNTIPAQERAKTHCLNGHPFAGDNVYVSRRGCRHCKECARIRQATPAYVEKSRARSRRHVASGAAAAALRRYRTRLRGAGVSAPASSGIAGSACDSST